MPTAPTGPVSNFLSQQSFGYCPRAKRSRSNARAGLVGYLFETVAHLQVQALQNAARSLGVVLQIQNIRSSDDLAAAFETGGKERAEGLLTTAESIFSVHGARVTELAARYRLPAMYPNLQEAIDRGGLMAYAPNSADLYRRAVTYAARILKGAKPSDLPVQQPTKFELVINLKTAKALGLEIPPKVLALADEVFE